MNRGSLNPHRSDSTNAKTTALSPAPSATRPRKSILGGVVSSRLSGAAIAVIAKPAAISGMLIQKMSRQSSSTSAPPTSGPMPRATLETAVQIPIAVAWRSRGNTDETSASERPRTAAAPAPWSALPEISTPASGAVAAMTDPPAKVASPAR
jgi:hypothetical protein